MKPVFNKSERITSRKEISFIFDRGKSYFEYPFKILYIKREDNDPTRVLVSVPKKKFAKAVDRNLIKRRFREAYRCNKDQIYGKNYSVIFIYVARELLNYSTIENKLLKSIYRLNNID